MLPQRLSQSERCGGITYRGLHWDWCLGCCALLSCPPDDNPLLLPATRSVGLWRVTRIVLCQRGLPVPRLCPSSGQPTSINRFSENAKAQPVALESPTSEGHPRITALSVPSCCRPSQEVSWGHIPIKLLPSLPLPRN